MRARPTKVLSSTIGFPRAPTASQDIQNFLTGVELKKGYIPGYTRLQDRHLDPLEKEEYLYDEILGTYINLLKDFFPMLYCFPFLSFPPFLAYSLVSFRSRD